MLILSSEQLKLHLIREIGIDHIKKASPQARQRHKNMQLTFMLKGTLVWKNPDGRQIRLNGGEFCITQPGDVFDVLYDVLSPCHLLWMIFDPFAPGAEAGSLFSRDELVRMGSTLAGAGDAVRKIPRELAFYLKETVKLSQTYPWEGPGNPGANKMLLLLLGVFIESVETLSGGSHLPGLSGTAIGRRVRELILRQPHKGLSMDKLADSLGLSHSLFSKKFKQETGLSPADFVRRVKLEEAVRMMRTSTSITEIAFALGFSSSQYFSTIFKQYFGRSPGQFRKEQLN